MGDEDRGALLYGYDRDRAGGLGKFLGNLTGRDVIMYGGSGMEARTVMDILDGEPGQNFSTAEPRMLMFLGFDDEEIGAALKAFPEDMPRPIFCAPTENNMGWTLSALLEHLLEEQRQFSLRKR